MNLYRKIIVENKIENYAHCKKAKLDLSLINGPYIWDVDFDKIVNETGVSIFQKYAEPPEDKDLIKLISEYENVPEDYIMLTPGADIGIELVYRQFVENGDSACIVIPTFPRFEIVLSTISEVNIEYKQRLNEIDKDYKLICLCTPNNPTTKQLDRTELESLIEKRQRSLVCIDSVFERYGDYKVVDLCEKYSNVVILKSFSKIGLAGLRLGYVISNPENIKYLRVGQSPFSVSSMSQKIGVQIVHQFDKLKKFDQIVENSFQQIKSALNDKVIRGSRVPFYLLTTKVDSTKAVHELNNCGISVVDGKNFRGLGSYSLRVALGSEEENELFIRSITDLQIV